MAAAINEALTRVESRLPTRSKSGAFLRTEMMGGVTKGTR
jgi:hypothetical protein